MTRFQMKAWQQIRTIRGTWLLLAWFGGMAIVPGLPAQPAARKLDNRFLLVFDTSAEMKHRVAAVQNTLNTILATSANGQLHSNDSIGVWTFDQQLETGQFPLQRWNPDHAAQVLSNINTFVVGRRYTKKTTFDALMPLVNQVVGGSERLTVVIFCDGYGEMNGTPYDQGVNQLFQQRQGERQKAQQPVVIVLHSQLGQFVDCVVSFPPQPVSFPEFPPLPVPPPAPKVVPPPPRAVVPPLIIIGTPVTNRPPPPAPPVPEPVPAPLPTNAPLPAANPTAAPPVAPEVKPPEEMPLTRPDGAPPQLKIDAELLPRTNAVNVPAENSGFNRAEAFAIGATSLLVGGLVVFLFGRARPPKKG